MTSASGGGGGQPNGSFGVTPGAAVSVAVGAPNADPAIESLKLAPVASAAAYALKAAHPDVVFTSGRRDRAAQCSAMASNVIHNRSWIQQTYKPTLAAVALNRWVQVHFEAITVDTIAAGLLATLNQLSDAEVGKLSLHLTGQAFDVLPVLSPKGDAIKAAIRQLPGLSLFLEREGGLVRWHAEFR